MAITKDKRNRYREKSLGQTHLFNIVRIETMDRTPGQAQVMSRPLDGLERGEGGGGEMMEELKVKN